jgi:hypothetical protein
MSALDQRRKASPHGEVFDRDCPHRAQPVRLEWRFTRLLRKSGNYMTFCLFRVGRACVSWTLQTKPRTLPFEASIRKGCINIFPGAIQ